MLRLTGEQGAGLQYEPLRVCKGHALQVSGRHRLRDLPQRRVLAFQRKLVRQMLFGYVTPAPQPLDFRQPLYCFTDGEALRELQPQVVVMVAPIFIYHTVQDCQYLLIRHTGLFLPKALDSDVIRAGTIADVQVDVRVPMHDGVARLRGRRRRRRQQVTIAAVAVVGRDAEVAAELAADLYTPDNLVPVLHRERRRLAVLVASE